MSLTRKDRLAAAGGQEFDEFVVERGEALYRTAVLLTHHEQTAQDLAQIALGKAWQAWARIDGNHEAEVRRIMINEFAASWRRRWRDVPPLAELPEPQGVDDDRGNDDGDDDLSMHQVLMAALAILCPRQRAVVVLRFFHDYSAAATAEAMGIKVGTVKSQTVKALSALRVFEELRQGAAPDLTGSAQPLDLSTRTVHDLRAALHKQANAAACPDVDLLVFGAKRRVAATRQRRLRLLGSTTVAVLVVGGLVATRATHPALPQASGLGPFTVDAGGAGFPEYALGMKRLTVVDSPMLERMKGLISVPTTPGRQLWVRMVCTPTSNQDNLDDWNARMLASFVAPGGTGSAVCSSGWFGDAPLGIATAAKTTVSAEILISHEPSPSVPSLFKDARIHVAFYENVPWEDYPLPLPPIDLETNPQYAWASERGTHQVLGPTTPQEANKPLTFTRPSDPKLSLNLQVRGPGRMRVLVNGNDITTQMDASPWSPDKFIEFWGYTGAPFNYPLDPGSPTTPGRPVTVTIDPRDFQGPDWRILMEPRPLRP